MTRPETPARPWTALDADAKDALIGELVEALELGLEYWAHRQQRYRNRWPVWVQTARAALAKAHGNG